jgi:5'-3' exonuclease
MINIIDADHAIYYCGCSSEVEEAYYSVGTSTRFNYKKGAVEYCLQNDIDLDEIKREKELLDADAVYPLIDKYFRRIFKETGISEYIAYYGEGTTFRHNIIPDYKANRDSSSKPLLYDTIKMYLADVWECQKVVDIETDDQVLITYNERGCEDIIVSVDKDLDQQAGIHYSPLSGMYEVDEWEGLLNLYKQIIQGDSSDNIQGLHGFGPAKSAKALVNCTTEKELWDTVVALYEKKNKKVEDANITAQLVYLLRSKDDKWQPPT